MTKLKLHNWYVAYRYPQLDRRGKPIYLVWYVDPNDPLSDINCCVVGVEGSVDAAWVVIDGKVYGYTDGTWAVTDTDRVYTHAPDRDYDMAIVDMYTNDHWETFDRHIHNLVTTTWRNVSHTRTADEIREFVASLGGQ